jgi:GGDEF domain-containing protein
MTEHEAERLASIAQLSLVEGEIIKEIQHLAEAAAFIAKTPMAFASLVGQHSLDFVANVGMPNVESIPRDTSFCEHLQSGEPRLVITDAMMDQRFIDAPLVNGPPFLRAYAGHMIEAAPGQPAGALCVVDTHPRAFEPPVLKQLGHLAEVASHILCARNTGSDLAPSTETTDRDPLTDLLNQAAFRARVNDTLHNTQSAYTLALIDVDHFKYINDHLGHTFGDQFLIELSKAVSATLGQDAIVGRIGGDEFAALLPPQPVSECEKRIEAMRLRSGAPLSIWANLSWGASPLASADAPPMSRSHTNNSTNARTLPFALPKTAGATRQPSIHKTLMRFTIYERNGLPLQAHLQTARLNRSFSQRSISLAVRSSHLNCWFAGAIRIEA